MISENGGARTLEIYLKNGKKVCLHLDDNEQCKIVDGKLFINAGYSKVSIGFENGSVFLPTCFDDVIVEG